MLYRQLILTHVGTGGVDGGLDLRRLVAESAKCAGGFDRGVDVDELHRRLLEFGFVEGARVEVLHEGAIWRDPIAVRLDDMRIALRRRDAEDVWVRLDVQ